MKANNKSKGKAKLSGKTSAKKSTAKPKATAVKGKTDSKPSAKKGKVAASKPADKSKTVKKNIAVSSKKTNSSNKKASTVKSVSNKKTLTKPSAKSQKPVRKAAEGKKSVSKQTVSASAKSVAGKKSPVGKAANPAVAAKKSPATKAKKALVTNMQKVKSGDNQKTVSGVKSPNGKNVILPAKEKVSKSAGAIKAKVKDANSGIAKTISKSESKNPKDATITKIESAGNKSGVNAKDKAQDSKKVKITESKAKAKPEKKSAITTELDSKPAVVAVSGKKSKVDKEHDPDGPPMIPEDLPLDLIDIKPKRGKGKPKAPSGPKLVMKVFTTAKSALPEAFVDPPKNYKKTKYIKFELEYMIHSSKHILFNYLSTEAGLKEWFADDVKEVGDIFTFFWDGSSQMARLISMKEDHHVRFRWVDMYEPVFFEFRLDVDELTGDLALIITDFAEDEVAVESAKLLWKSQIESLFQVLGAHS